MSDIIVLYNNSFAPMALSFLGHHPWIVVLAYGLLKTIDTVKKSFEPKKTVNNEFQEPRTEACAVEDDDIPPLLLTEEEIEDYQATKNNPGY